MEILAGLIRIGPGALPVPWYNRPALGLVTGTSVTIALIKSKDSSSDQVERPPDLIVTPLSVDDLKRTCAITIDTDESPGSIRDSLKCLDPDLNISLLESVTIDQRSRHRLTIVVQPYNRYLSDESFNEKLKDFLSKIQANPKPVPYFLANDNIEIGKRIPGRIDHGMIQVNDLEGQIRKSFPFIHEKYDLKKVVISSNSDARFVRYIFPLKGTFEIGIVHKDSPGAMRELVRALNRLGYNILLSRISKSVSLERGEQFSLTVAICEPVNFEAALEILQNGEDEYKAYVAGSIDNILNYDESSNLLEYMFEVTRDRISLGRQPSEVKSNVTSRLAVKEVAVPPEYRRYLRTFESGRKVVFVSQVSTLEREENSTGRRVRDTIYEAIEESGHVVFDGYSRPSKLKSKDSTEILSRAWRSDAAIFIGFNAKSPQWLTQDQIVEWGVLHGLTGKTLICTDIESIKKKVLMMPQKIEIILDDMSTDSQYNELRDDIKAYLDGWFA